MKQSTPRQSRSRVENPTTEFTFGSGALYANSDEYASKALAFDILAIAFEPGKGYEGANRWAITIKAEERDAEILTLGANPKRDEQLREAQAHLERGGSIPNTRLRRSGSAYYFVSGAK